MGTAAGKTTAMTYQNIWGLAPKDRSRRVVIGESVFLPLLPQYPENKSLVSLPDKRYFQVVYLGEWPLHHLIHHIINLHDLIYPEA